VNSAFTVFSKSTGAVLKGPMDGNTLWQGFGGACETNNDGDPIANYDKQANRWVLTQFVVAGGAVGFWQCVAVSTTSDATGSYRRFAFQITDFNDYPKLGVWPDAYYITFNMFAATGGNFLGSRLCAVDRNQMLTANGTPGPIQCFQLTPDFGGVLPSDLDGARNPPAGSPAFMLSHDSAASVLHLWKFHVDWATPGNSTVTGPTNIPVAPFSEACGGGTCIPQKGTTQTVDSLADRLMYRLAYRNFGDHEAMVVSHSVTVGSNPSGIRWYEIRNPNGTPTLFQQSTFSPDTTTARWMGSIAMDQAGNMGLGYSASSGSINPAIRFTGRLVTDALNTMQTEATIINGTGSQTASLNRWGDYSAMAIDPTDDCTFWYTTEYLTANGTFNWHTRIASFKFPSCGGAATPDFNLQATPASVSVTQGASGTSSIRVSSVNGFNSAVSLSASGVPSGVTASFSPTSVTPPANGNASSTLTFTASASAATGTFSVTVSGASGSTTRTTSVSLTVNATGGGNGTVVSLGGAANVFGHFSDGTPVTNGGLDGGNNAYSSNQFGATRTIGGVQFSFGAPNTANAAANTTITLPAGRFSSLRLLAAAVQGNQANQAFRVNFSDSTSTTFTQSVSDWFTPQNFPGETIAVTTNHRNTAGGTADNRTFLLYAYSFSLNSAKTVSSLTLPANRNVIVLAATLVAASGGGGNPTPVSLTFNRLGIAADGSTFSGGLDGGGSAYSSNLLGTSQTIGGIPFTIGPANANDVVSAAGQTITLPAGQFSSLRMLATAVNGNQTSQSFVVTFSDSTSTTFTQSLSDWFTPQSFAGESTAVTMNHRNTSTGTADNRTFLLYAYSFALNNTKTVSSLRLPNNASVEVLSITLVP
jgi:hypothetical protein